MEGKINEKNMYYSKYYSNLNNWLFFCVKTFKISQKQKEDNHILFENAKSTCILSEGACGLYSSYAENQNSNERYINTNNESIKKLQSLYDDTKILDVSKEYTLNLINDISTLINDIEKNNININKVYGEYQPIVNSTFSIVQNLNNYSK